MSGYRQRLARHPGIIPAWFMTVMMLLAASAREEGTLGGWILAGLFIFAIWATVLWTARA